MSWKDIMKSVTPQDRQIIQSFFEAWNNTEDIFEEMGKLRNAGRMQTEEQLRPIMQKKAQILRKLQQTAGQYAQALERDLK